MMRSAALSGLFIGVLSALPILGAANCCCCLWIVSGGALASFLERQQQDRTLTPGEGAGVGALAGVFGAFIWAPIAGLIALVLGPLQRAALGEVMRNARDIPPETRELIDAFAGPGSVVGFVLSFFLLLTVGAVMAALGGLLGAMYFKKEVPPALGGSWVPPLPPQ